MSDDDYESPDADDDDGSVGDYESPTQDSDNDYEPPPSEPPDEIPHKLCAAKRMAEDDYIGMETSV